MTMATLYSVITYLCILLNIGALVASCVIFPQWIKKRYFTVSRSENIDGDSKIIYEVEDPFGDSSGFPMNDGLKEARQWLAKMFMDGTGCLCPACGQRVQKYRRQIYAAMVDGLLYISKNPGAESDKLRYFGGGDYAKLAHWGLIEQDKNKQWRCTPKGESFLRGETFVPKYIYIYNAVVFGRSEERVDVYQCAGKKFSTQDIQAAE